MVGGFFWKDESIGCANVSGKVGGGDNRKVTNLGITRVCGPQCLGQASREKTIAGSSSLPAGLKVPYRGGQDGRGEMLCPQDSVFPRSAARKKPGFTLQRAGCKTLLPWWWLQGEVCAVPAVCGDGFSGFS